MKLLPRDQRPGQIRFAVLGDVEPKPHPVFSNLTRAIDIINQLHEKDPIDFVASIGDITHRGTAVQYEAVSPLIQRLEVPIHAIMGNEEVTGGKARFLEHAALWNAAHPHAGAPELRFIKRFGPFLFIFITAETNGVAFSEQELDWLTLQLQTHPDEKVILFTHAPALDIFPSENARSIPNRRFAEILRFPNLGIHFSGHTHMDPDFIGTYVVDPHHVNHIHAPGIERTKVGATHTPRIRIVTIHADSTVDVQTWNLITETVEPRHRICFRL